MQAFIKLESIDSLTQEQKKSYEELALEIFTKYVNVDSLAREPSGTSHNSFFRFPQHEATGVIITPALSLPQPLSLDKMPVNCNFTLQHFIRPPWQFASGESYCRRKPNDPATRSRILTFRPGVQCNKDLAIASPTASFVKNWYLDLGKWNCWNSTVSILYGLEILQEFCLGQLRFFGASLLGIGQVSHFSSTLLMKKLCEPFFPCYIFRHSPKDSRGNKAECTSCETMIPDW